MPRSTDSTRSPSDRPARMRSPSSVDASRSRRSSPPGFRRASPVRLPASPPGPRSPNACRWRRQRPRPSVSNAGLALAADLADATPPLNAPPRNSVTFVSRPRPILSMSPLRGCSPTSTRPVSAKSRPAEGGDRARTRPAEQLRAVQPSAG
jgi:hypothetical protein